MAEGQRLTGELTPSRTLTRREFLASFQFSQGDPCLQQDIFMYLKHLHPELHLSDDDVVSLAASCSPPGVERALDPRRHTAFGGQRRFAERGYTTYPPDALIGELRWAQKILGEEPGELRWAQRSFGEEIGNLDQLLNRMLRSIVSSDYEFLNRRAGRGYVPDGTPHYNPYKDPWRSDLCYFGFLGNTTGLTDFDHMFADIVAYCREHPPREADPSKDWRIEEKLPEMVAMFNAHHPLTPVALEEPA